MPDLLDDHIEWSRAEKASQFKETAVATRVTGPKVLDPTTGQYTTPTTTVYDGDTPGAGGPCEIRPAKRDGQLRAPGEGQVRENDYDGKFPHDTDLRIGDDIRCTGSEWDADLARSRFRVTDSWVDSRQVYRYVGLKLLDRMEVES